MPKNLIRAFGVNNLLFGWNVLKFIYVKLLKLILFIVFALKVFLWTVYLRYSISNISDLCVNHGSSIKIMKSVKLLTCRIELNLGERSIPPESWTFGVDSISSVTDLFGSFSGLSQSNKFYFNISVFIEVFRLNNYI